MLWRALAMRAASPMVKIMGFPGATCTFLLHTFCIATIAQFAPPWIREGQTGQMAHQVESIAHTGEVG